MSAVAVDSSSFIGYLNGRPGDDTAAVKTALAEGTAVLPPMVVTEVLSLPGVSAEVIRLLGVVPRLPLLPDYWERAGQLRGGVNVDGRRARLADTLIAQCCLDSDVPLITADADFRHFVSRGLRLVV